MQEVQLDFGFCNDLLENKSVDERLNELILETKDKEEFFMRTVYSVADLSKDPRTKIGAVLVKNNNIISCGYNNFPRKVLDLKARYENKEVKYKFICHAESNSILNAARAGISTDNSILFTQGCPCQECCKSLIQAGVSKIVIHKQWPNLTHSVQWVESIECSKIMIQEAEIDIKWLDKVLNIKGFLDGKEINV